MNPGTKTQVFNPKFGNLHGVEHVVPEICPYQLANSLEKGYCVFLGGLALAP